MKHIQLTNWEANIIQVGLTHIIDEFIFLDKTQKQFINNLLIEFDGFIQDDKIDFPVNNTDIVLITMATTEIFLLHNDLSKFGENDTKFSLDIVEQCQNIINKLMKG